MNYDYYQYLCISQHGGGGGGGGIGCYGSPCAFGCTPHGHGGFSCGCPSGYQRIGQVYMLTILHYNTQDVCYSRLSCKGSRHCLHTALTDHIISIDIYY